MMTRNFCFLPTFCSKLTMPTEHTRKVQAKPTTYASKPGPEGVSGETESVVDEDEVEECPQPQMSRPEMAKLSETLWLVCIGAEVEAAYELSKVLRTFEAQIRTLDLQKSTQQRLGGWLRVGESSSSL